MAIHREQRTSPSTMHDEATLAGVSQTMVSFGVNNTPTVSIPEETRQRILAAIQQLDYRPNADPVTERASSDRFY